MNPFIDIHPVAIGPHLEAELEVTEAKAEAGGILQLRVHLPPQLPADADLPRRFPAMVKIPPFSRHGTCIKVTGQGATDSDGQRGDLYVVLKLSDAEALTSIVPPPLRFDGPRARSLPRALDQHHRRDAIPNDELSSEDLAAQIEEIRRRYYPEGTRLPDSSNSSSNEEAEAAQGCFGMLLGLLVAAILGGASKFAHISNTGEWLADTLPALLVAVVAFIGFIMLGKMAEAIFGEGAKVVAQIAATGAALGLLLAPSWAWMTHDSDWRIVLTAKILPGLLESGDATPETASVENDSSSPDRTTSKSHPQLGGKKLVKVSPLGAGNPNSLGMKFKPVPGTKVMFSIWETRMQDYAAFVRDTGHKWNRPTSEFLQPEGKSAKLTVDDVPTFPAFHLSWQDARAFCIWLSKKEGRTYRLPTDHEWSMAVGIGHLEKEDESPAAKNLKVKGGASELVSELETLQTLLDGNHEASNGPMPVGSFAANDLGLYDLRGNVDELCLDLLDPTDPAKGRVLRGGGWLTIRVFDQKFKASGKTLQSEHIGNIVSSSFRRSTNETDLQAGAGFRCVLEESSRANQ